MIEFEGIDILTERALGDDLIRDVLAVALFVDNARVAVLRDIAQYPARADADLVCIVTPISGEFVELISTHCEPTMLPFASILDLMSELSMAFGARLLVPDDEQADPYSFWLVEPGRSPLQVDLDVAALDDDRYELDDREQP